MWRIAFLILVVIGALAVVIGLVAGVGAMQLARTSGPGTLPTTSPADLQAPATQPTAQIPIPPPMMDTARAAEVVPQSVLAVGAARPVVTAAVLVEPAGGQGGLAIAAINLSRADKIEPLSLIQDGMTIDLSSLPTRRLTLSAVTTGKVGSVRFDFKLRDEARRHIENAAPYTIDGDGNGIANPFALLPGQHAITATPYTAADAGGEAGRPRTVRFTVVDTGGPLLLKAAQATLHGDKIALQGAGGEKSVAFWRSEQDGIEWFTAVPRAGSYKVEMTYACDPHNGGGEFELLVAKHRITSAVIPTDSWVQYNTIEVAQIKLPAGELPVNMRALRLAPDHALMHLRSIRLVPVD